MSEPGKGKMKGGRTKKDPPCLVKEAAILLFCFCIIWLLEEGILLKEREKE